MSKKKAIVAILNWGLGHATRSCPVIQSLLDRNINVELASDGASLALVRQAFPDLTYHTFPSYDINYPPSGNISMAVAKALPSLLKSIKDEHALLKSLRRTSHYDFIISDNRYGCYLDEVPSIFLGHQLRIQLPKRSTFIEKILFKAQGNYLVRFNECWVPDLPGELNYSGSLSHNCKLDIPIHFIGPLSRIPYTDHIANNSELNVLGIVSGPESQRTIFEEKLIRSLLSAGVKGTVLRGLPHMRALKKNEGKLTILNHCDANEFAGLVQAADLVISRSGYSTIMDLSKTNKKALFIPTPGQSEQYYLARYLSEQGICHWQEQDQMDIQKGIPQALAQKGFSATESVDVLNNNLHRFLASIP